MRRGNKRGRPASTPTRGGRGSGRGTGRGRGRGGYAHTSSEIDVDVQMYQQQSQSDAFYTSPRGRGRGIGSQNQPQTHGRYAESPASRRGSAFNTPRGKPRGNPKATLSRLLAGERPYLKPIVFVPSAQTPFLFQEKEEILRPIVDEDEAETMPTADQVTRVFSGSFPTIHHDYGSDAGLQDLVEIDFNDIGKMQEEVDKTVPPTKTAPANNSEEVFTGKHKTPKGLQGNTNISSDPSHDSVKDVFKFPLVDDTNPVAEKTIFAPLQPTQTSYIDDILAQIDHNDPDMHDVCIDSTSTTAAVTEQLATFFIDTEPAHVPTSIPFTVEEAASFVVDTEPAPATQNTPKIPTNLDTYSIAMEMDDEIIVFQPQPSSPKSASSTSHPTHAQSPILSSTSHGRTKAKIRTRRRELLTKRSRARAKQDPRYAERRRGDDDLDWGSDDGVEIRDGAEGMSIDPELQMDIETMKRFAESLVGQTNHITMDDIADAARIRDEDEAEDSDEGGSSVSGKEDGEDGEDEREKEAIIIAEEGLLIGEPVDDVPSEDTDEDGHDSEDASEEFDNADQSFQARLQRLRTAKAKRKQLDDEFDDRFEFEDHTDEDDSIATVEMLREKSVLSSNGLKKKNSIFASSHNGTFSSDDNDGDELESIHLPKRKKQKPVGLSAELEAQWEADRQRKAANKRLRQEQRLALATDPLSEHKGGKKGRKAMLAAARVDPHITVLPNRIIDVTTLVQQIQRFIADIGGPQSMSLPPTNKNTRKAAHELALAFGLKSDSKGKGNFRYTTLKKTTRTGLTANWVKVNKIIKREGAGGLGWSSGGTANGPRGTARHKEGDEVGKSAPKIGESNKGFRMLTLMGWAEGDRLGTSDGLKDPLTAVIKNTKLGLGATK